MKTFFRFLNRNKLYTFINIFGLGISLAFILLIAAYTTKQLHTDDFQENADRIFLLHRKNAEPNCYWLHHVMKERYAEIECAVSVWTDRKEVIVADTRTTERVMIADSAFFDMFTFPLIDGREGDFKLSTENCVVSRTFAQNHFGERSAIGQTLTFGNDETSIYTIVGVIDDIDNSIFPDSRVIIRGEKTFLYDRSSYKSLEGSNCLASFTFVMTYPNCDINARNAEILEYFQSNYWVYEGAKAAKKRVIFTPLRELYFGLNMKYFDFNNGERSFVMVLISVGFILLIFAILNYINLTVAQSTFRAREMAMRRLLGTSRWGIFSRLIGESTLLCVASLLVALLMAYNLSPAASTLLNYPFGVADLFTPLNLCIILAVICLLGLLTGIIPAALLSRYSAIAVVKGEFGAASKMIYGKVMIGLQYVIAIGMIVASGICYQQVNHLIEAPLGYNTTDVMIIKEVWQNKDLMTLREELQRLPCVKRVGVGGEPPYEGGVGKNIYQYKGDQFPVTQFVGDSIYYQILDLQFKGHSSTPGHGGFPNETCFKNLGMDESATAIPFDNKVCDINGVVKDFRIKGILTKVPSALVTIINWPTSVLQFQRHFEFNILVETIGNHAEAREAITTLIKKIYPETGAINDRTVVYLDEVIARDYDKEQRLLRIIVIFTMVAILIATLGLFAMSSYYIRQRRKDIAIRRIFGSTRYQIVCNLLKPFLVIVIIAIPVACPVIYLVMKQWLEEYSYHIDQPLSLYLLAGLFALCMATITIIGLTVKASADNPVEVLKKE